MSLTRKQITFDLNQEALRQWYPHREPVGDPQYYKRAYKDIQRFMIENGFERRQRSVYVSTEELTTLDVVNLMQQMSESCSLSLPLSCKCVSAKNKWNFPPKRAAWFTP